MPPRTRKAKVETTDEFVKIGDRIDVEGNSLAILPDGTVVTIRGWYTIQHEGLHTIDGVEYLAGPAEK